MKLFSNIGPFTQTVGPRNAIDETMTISLIIQRIFGQHILDPNWTLKRFILYQIAFASLIIYVAIGTKDILLNTNDITVIAEASYTYVICGILIIKYILFVEARITFRELYVKAKTSIYEVITDDSPNKMAEVLKKGEKVIRIMSIMAIAPVIAYVLRVLWFYVKGTRVTFSKTTSTLLPMTTPCYEIATILHAIFMTETALTYIVIDTWFIFLLNLYCHACDSVVKILDVTREDGETEEQYACRLNGSLRKFYSGHVKLVEYLATFNKTFTWQSLVPLITIITCFCIPMLSMSKGLDISFAMNLTSTVTEIFVFNWFGEQIKTKASDLRDAIINFDWVYLQLRDKKSYYVIMCFMNKEFGVTTAIGSDLSLITLTSVLKVSYQAFTMLQSFDN